MHSELGGIMNESKRAYEAPLLELVGTLAELVQQDGPDGVIDNATGGGSNYSPHSSY